VRNAARVKRAAFTQHPRPAYYDPAPEAMGASMRTDRYRYTEWRDWSSGELVGVELYDHASDPLETRNIAPHQPRTLAELGRLMRDSGAFAATPGLGGRTTPR
jgi:hypothetical protein